ncbi:MAG: NADPH2 dehydrogenase, partial [Planctomycetota bacterium]
PLTVGSMTMGNRFAIHPMEGWDANSDGTPSEHTLRRWRQFGRSGAKLIWGGEAFAVQEDGRANPNQLFLNPEVDVKAALAQLLAEVEQGHGEIGQGKDDLVVGLQLTHSGRFAKPGAAAAPGIAAHHPILDARMGITNDDVLLSDEELETIGANYVQLAKLAHEVGFSFVDVKCCHGYLLHELLGARTRPGPYGGSFDNRTRLFRQIVDSIRRECPGLEIAVRISIADVFPFSKNKQTGIGEPQGWDAELPFEFGFGLNPDNPRELSLDEPFQFLSLLRSMGLTFVNLSLGSPYYCPHIQRPAAFPPSDGYLPPEDPLTGVTKHLRVVRECKQAFPDLTIVGSGYSYLQEQLPYVAQHEVRNGHVDFVGLGRMVLSYPELPDDILNKRTLAKKKFCRTFSDCTTAPRHGLLSGCYPLDPYYQELPEASQVKDIKRKIRRENNS